MALRVQRHSENGQKIAEYLEDHPQVSWVNYPGLVSNHYYKLGKKYLPKGCGSIFTFGIKGGTVAAKEFVHNLKLFSLLANVADAKSLIIHPSSTTHAQLSQEQQILAGVDSDLLRLSIGIEDSRDLINDLEQAFKAVANLK